MKAALPDLQMILAKKLNRNLRIAENVIFIGAFAFVMYNLVSTYGIWMYRSIKGKGYLGAIIDPFVKHQYFVSLVSIIVILNSTLVLWEVFSVLIRLLRQEKNDTKQGYAKYKAIFNKVAVHYKASFIAMLALELLPKLILFHMFWNWLPHFQKFQLFTVNLKWYSWIYGYLCYELASWLFHFSSHRVRFLWCLHSPHHAPSEMNLAVNWVHFFAESYYSAFVRLFVLLLLGVNPAMFAAVISIDSAWGIFIHVSERTIGDGKLGVLHHLIITPSHHRVHHAKNPLYIDTNFANVLPIWDWVMGTLQPLRKEVHTDYGISRELDVTNFSDLYFGELILLYRDVKNAAGIKNKLLYVFMPSGWTPNSSAETAGAIRRRFLKMHPALAVTNRKKVVDLIKARLNGYQAKPKEAETLAPQVVDVVD